MLSRLQRGKVLLNLEPGDSEAWIGLGVAQGTLKVS